MREKDREKQDMFHSYFMQVNVAHVNSYILKMFVMFCYPNYEFSGFF